MKGDIVPPGSFGPVQAVDVSDAKGREPEPIMFISAAGNTPLNRLYPSKASRLPPAYLHTSCIVLWYQGVSHIQPEPEAITPGWQKRRRFESRPVAWQFLPPRTEDQVIEHFNATSASLTSPESLLHRTQLSATTHSRKCRPKGVNQSR
jgi:hypothetical protein